MFQKRIVEKYSAKLNKTIIDEKYDLFRSIFANPEKQENIRNSKEEQYQEGFLRDLFVSVLGYTINPEPNYNLLTEQKNISKGNDNRKADGAVIFDNKVKVVIELKGTDTTDLNKIESQAFLYKEHNPECKYVIISNFERLRFYVENAIEFIEFNLFNLSKNEFQMLYLCLEINQIKNDIPLQLKHETLSQEQEITDSFYNDYSVFKRNLFEDIYTNNPDYDKLLLFKKTQKLLDRILFILFCEDRGLLPENSVNKIIAQWEQLKDLDAYQPLYSRFQNFFNRINEGYTSPKNPSENIFAYNGGLFKPDEILDNIKIGDDVLFLYSKRLSDYDFESQISVDILGNIFEHSLTEIEEVQKQIEAEKSGLTTEKTDIGKRKKDGVFYTPSYITKYIVENTIGKLCNEKKEKLGIKDSAFSKSKKTSKEKEELNKKLEEYKEWLLSLKILDPACGSGAFLNAALKQLKIEHTLIDYYRAKIYGDTMIFQDVENDILEKNIFGVDINDESVEIAKLSLWLHTAQKNRKLTTLNNNIKCGNSLIDDSEVAGEKAFNWQKEFPEVFEKGGFDVIIGNPPYVRIQGIKSNKEDESFFYEKNYKSAIGRYDLYILFIEKSLSLINQNGLVSFILPHNFLIADLGKGIRNYLAHSKNLNELIHFGSYLVFEEAQTYTCIIKLTGKENKGINFTSINPLLLPNKNFNFDFIDYSELNSDKWNLTDNKSKKLLDKISKSKYKISEYFSNVGRGIVSGFDDCFILQGEIKNNLFYGFSKALNLNVEIESNLVKPILMGNSVHFYSKLNNDLFIIYPHIEKDGKTEPINETILKNDYPKTYNYLCNFKEQLVAKKIKYKTNPNFWYSLHNSREISLFNQKKIITPYLANKCQMSFDNEGTFITNDKCSILKLKNEFDDLYLYFLAILNSKLCFYFIKNTSSEFQGGYFVFSNLFLNPFPVPEIADNKDNFSELAEKMLNLNADLQKLSSKFLGRLKESLGVEKITSTLEEFFNYDFETLVKELSKQKIKLSLKQKDEWEDYFTDYKNEITGINQQIKATDKEINSLVYKLYELTPQEIETIEKC